MPSLSKLPDNLKRKKLCRALERLGFEINTKGGNGSHIKAICIRNQKVVIIPEPLKKHVLYYVLKQLQQIGGVTWKDIQEYL